MCTLVEVSIDAIEHEDPTAQKGFISVYNCRDTLYYCWKAGQELKQSRKLEVGIEAERLWKSAGN